MEENTEEKSLVSVLVANVPGTLAAFASFMGKNSVNIEKLVVASANRENTVQRIIAYVGADRARAQGVFMDLEKEANILAVDNFMTNGEYIERELCLIKMSATNEALSSVMSTVSEFNGKTIYAEKGVMIFQIIDDEETVENVCEKISFLSDDIEISRSGLIATGIDLNIRKLSEIKNLLTK